MEKINDYLTDYEIYKLVESSDSYREVTEKIENEYGVEFSANTVGSHYRDFKNKYVVIETDEEEIKGEGSDIVEFFAGVLLWIYEKVRGLFKRG